LAGIVRSFEPGYGRLAALEFVPSGYVELGSASGTVTTNSGQASAALDLSWSLAATIPAGHQLELKLVAGGGTLDVNVAYDTTDRLSRLVLLQQPAS
jgi:hypothetical protein